MKHSMRLSASCLFISVLCGCAASGNGSSAVPTIARLPEGVRADALGPVLRTSDGGQIFGFDIDQNGSDGMLTSATQSEISVQTFNTTTGKITKTFAVVSGEKVMSGDDYVTDGIFDGDVGLIDFQKAGIPGKTPTQDTYRLLNPVTKNRLNGHWSPSLHLFNALAWAPNQSTATSVLFGYERSGSDPSELVVSDIAENTVSNVIGLSSTDFALGTQPQLAQDTVNDLAVMASSPSFGAAGGPPPVISTIDLQTGKLTQFHGVSCPGSVGCGYANGIGYDSATGVACTTTELDGGVEFYDVAKQTGTRELLPGGNQFYAGAFVASDAVHKLFLIAQPESSTGSGSSIQVYEENGTLLKSIDGFNFTDAGDLVIPIRIAINPHKRIGWVNGPQVSELQEFSY
jgi:hypothetical protein